MTDEIKIVDLPAASAIQSWSSDSSYGWDVQDIGRDNIVRVVIDDGNKHYVLPSRSGLDYNTIVQGDVHAVKVTAQHHPLHIKGKIIAETLIEGREALFSASSIEENAGISGGRIILVDDYNLSRRSKNLTKGGFNINTPVVEVPAEHREEIWRCLSGIDYDNQLPPLHRNRDNLDVCLKALHDKGWLKQTSISLGRYGISQSSYNLGGD